MNTNPICPVCFGERLIENRIGDDKVNYPLYCECCDVQAKVGEGIIYTRWSPFTEHFVDYYAESIAEDKAYHGGGFYNEQRQ